MFSPAEIHLILSIDMAEQGTVPYKTGRGKQTQIVRSNLP